MNENERKIAEYIKSENGNVTAKEISERLHFSTSTVNKVIRRYNLQIVRNKKNVYKKRLCLCVNRPQGCFECQYDDCICNSKKNEQETEYMLAACIGE